MAHEASGWALWAAVGRRQLTNNYSESSRRLALAAGCDWDTSESASALLKWLRAAPAEALVAAVDAAKTSEERRRGVLATFVPCVEPAAASDPFLPDEPDALLANGAAQRVPIVFGLTSHEGIFLLPGE
ncbi:Uncharacterized protein GBIM_00243 [Gryllus bimaculatus]|nr:Uncharacterized protein GBIM_00243 [Gryllus bimaculatus]